MFATSFNFVFLFFERRTNFGKSKIYLNILLIQYSNNFTYSKVSPFRFIPQNGGILNNVFFTVLSFLFSARCTSAIEVESQKGKKKLPFQCHSS